VYAFNPGAYPDPIPGNRQPEASGQASSDLQTGLFASLKVQLLRWWSVTAGLRVSNEKTTTTHTFIIGGTPYPNPPSYENDYVGKITPFVATEFRINDVYSVYASYADIYRSNQGFVTAGGKLLSPADGIDIEGGVKGVWRDGKLHGALTIYSIVQRGNPDLDPNAPIDAVSYVCCFFNSAKSKSRGIDLELSGTVSPGWLIGGGYSYNTTSETDNESDPNGQFESPQTPRHLLKVWTSARLRGHWQRWTVGATLLAQSSNFAPSYSCPTAYAGDCTSFESITSVQHPYAVVSPRVGYRIDGHWQLALTVNNIFDKHYYQTIGTPQDGSWYGDPRNYLLRLDAQF
jgi:outer membrane receptor for ferric coprogen and ferric-rhodotorulic acid